MKKEYYVNGRKTTKESLSSAFKGGNLCVCSVVNGDIYPLSWFLDPVDANQSRSWNRTGHSNPDQIQILDMRTMDLTKLNLKCYIHEYQERIMGQFKRAQNKTQLPT